MTRKKTKDEFVQEAKEIHGDTYDYSKVKYVNSHTKIIIICKEHGEFEKKPLKFLYAKQGCPKCSKNYIPNTSEWIQKAKEKHGDTYDYSKVEYVHSKKNVIIICKEHGEFQQRPSNHLRGAGCPICSKSYGTKEYIKEAKVKHGDKYDYSKVEYVYSQTKIIIICKEHGEFEQTPSSHLQGRGCPTCALIIRANSCKKSIEEFIEKAKEIHNDKYDYQKVDYVDNRTNVIIICKEHGEFQQRPNSHLNRSGCRKCGIIRRANIKTITNEEFIEKAKNIHGDKYDYSKVKYVKSIKNVTIICKKHGEFQQIPSNHLRGAGCPKCSYHRYYSNKQLKVLNLLSSYYNINIQHAENEGEYIISNSKYKADGYCKETNTIYEYHGDYWHGNPKIYNEYDINEVTGKTYGELYNNTIIKEKFIKEQGYNLVVIWENDFDNLVNIVKNIQKKWRNYKKAYIYEI